MESGVYYLKIDSAAGRYSLFLNGSLSDSGYASFNLSGKVKKLKTLTAQGIQEDKSLLSLNADHSWFFSEVSRDELALRLAGTALCSQSLAYSPAQVPLYVSIDGADYALAAFGETVSRASTRVNIEKLSADDYEGRLISGGYIFTLASPGDIDEADASFTTAADRLVKIDYPAAPNSLQLAYAQEFFAQVESSLSSAKVNDAANGPNAVIDLDSLSAAFLSLELLEIPPSGGFTPIAVKDRSSKLSAGPIKELETSLLLQQANSTSWYFGSTDIFAAFSASTLSLEKTKAKWESLRASAFSDESLANSIMALDAAYGQSFGLSARFSLIQSRLLARAAALDALVAELP
jgi:hypothetical protein